MRNLSQNRKIAISALAVFVASFSFMLVFLGDNENTLKSAKTDVLNIEEDADNLMFATDSEGNFLHTSDSFCEMMNQSCEEIIDEKIFDYVNKEDLADFASTYSNLAKNGEKADGLGPFRFINEDDENSLLILSAKPKVGGGQVIEIVFSAKDLTEHVKEFNSEKESKEPVESVESKKNWIEKIYPKIKDVEEKNWEKNAKLLVDKVS